MMAEKRDRIKKLIEDLELDLSGERKRNPSEFNPKPPKSKYFDEREPDQRFAGPEERKTFEIQQMWEVHHEIVRRLLLGQKASHIAKDLGVSAAMISYVRNSRVVKDKLELMKGARDAETLDLAKRIREISPKALDLLEGVIAGQVKTADGELMDVPLGFRIKESDTMLARAGYGPITNVKGQFAHGHFTKEDIDEIKSRARKDAISSGSVIDVTPEEVSDEETFDLSNDSGDDSTSRLSVSSGEESSADSA